MISLNIPFKISFLTLDTNPEERGAQLAILIFAKQKGISFSMHVPGQFIWWLVVDGGGGWLFV